jgi:hypothetical protein
MIKAILFDYDGVLTTDNTGSHTTNKHIGKVSGLSYDVVERAFTPFNFDLNIGRTTYEEVWPVVCSRMNYELDISGSFKNAVGNAAHEACGLKAEKSSLPAMRNSTVRMVLKLAYPRALRLAA